MTRTECGQRRQRYRSQIRAHLLMHHNLTLSGLARLVGVSVESVSGTIRGRIHSPRVLQALRDRGVPEKYLFDPHTVCAKGKGGQHERC